MTDLPVGPELDCLIAEKVMGWEQDGLGYSTGVASEYRHPFNPSTNMAHAWEVVEAMGRQLVSLIPFKFRDGWVCAIIDCKSLGELFIGHGDHYIDEHLDGTAEAPTAPLAICRAALAAVGRASL